MHVRTNRIEGIQTDGTNRIEENHPEHAVNAKLPHTLNRLCIKTGQNMGLKRGRKDLEVIEEGPRN